MRRKPLPKAMGVARILSRSQGRDCCRIGKRRGSQGIPKQNNFHIRGSRPPRSTHWQRPCPKRSGRVYVNSIRKGGFHHSPPPPPPCDRHVCANRRHNLIREPPYFVENRVNRPTAFHATRERHDAKRAEVVATAHDRAKKP